MMNIYTIDKFSNNVPPRAPENPVKLPEHGVLEVDEFRLEYMPFPTLLQIKNLRSQPKEISIILPVGHLIYAKKAKRPWELTSSYVKHRTLRSWKFSNTNMMDYRYDIFKNVCSVFKMKKDPIVVECDPEKYHGYDAIIIPAWHGQRVAEFKRTWNVVDNPAF